MAPQYKLTYFNTPGVAEPIRLLLAHAKIDYVDERIERAAWTAHKSQYTWGVLPVLEDDDLVLNQSLAILSYLAKKHGYEGDTLAESAKCDEYIGAVCDLKQALKGFNHEADPDKKAEKQKKLFQGTFPFYCAKFDAILSSNGDFLVGKKITSADFYLAHFVSIFKTLINSPKLLDAYPALKKHQITVLEAPAVKEWIANRPVPRNKFL